MRSTLFLSICFFLREGNSFTAFPRSNSQRSASLHERFSNKGKRFIIQHPTAKSTTTTTILKAQKDKGTIGVLEKIKSFTSSPEKSSQSSALIYEEDPTRNINNDDDTTIAKEFFPTFVLCWFVALLSSLDRTAMSVAILPLSSEYYLTDTIKGEISSVFSIGYGLAIIPCGLIAASVSPKWIMAFGVTLWSLATFGTPIAASLIQITQELPNVDDITLSATAAATTFVASNVGPLLLIRSVMGGAESVVFPATQRLLSNWVPASKKSIAVAIIYSGFQLGTVSAYLLSPWVIDNLGGWRGLFYVYGAVGALWLLPWAAFSKDSPDIDEQEDDVIINMKNAAVSTTLDETEETSSSTLDDAIAVVKDAPWSTFTKSKAVWAMIVAHAANNWGLYNLLSWTPTFYAEEYGLNVKESAFLSVFPSIAGAICGLSAGYLADKIISSIDSNDDLDAIRTDVRKAFQGIALLGPAACLLTLSSHIPENPQTAQALLMGTVGLQAFNAAGYGSAPQEKAGEKWSGLLYSITTLPGVMFGSFGVYVTGQVLDFTGQNWSQVYSINAGIDIIGALAFIALYDSRKEFD